MTLIEKLIDLAFTISEFVGLFLLSFSSPAAGGKETAPGGGAKSR